MLSAIRNEAPMGGVTTEMPMGFGPYVKALRERAGVKQRQVAEAIGMQQNQFSAIENNTKLGYLPSPQVVAGVARFFRVTEMELVRAAGYLGDSPAAKRLDDGGDEYNAAMDRIAQERGQQWMDHLVERIRTVIAEEAAPTPPSRIEQAKFGGMS